MNPEFELVDDSQAIERVSRLLRVGGFIGKKLATGLLVGTGFALPLIGAGTFLLNHAENNANSVATNMLNDAESRAQRTGSDWIFTFKAENTELLKSPLEGINSKLPEVSTTTTTTTLPSQEEVVSAADTLPSTTLAVDAVPDAATTTTTTVPPQG